jgi:membrane protein
VSTSPEQRDSSLQDDGGAHRGAAVALPGRVWGFFWRNTWGRLKHMLFVRALVNFFDHQMTDSAAALTYYALQSIFPGLLVVFAIFGLIGDTSIPKKAADELLAQGASPELAKVADDVLDQIVRASTGAASLALVLSLVLAINGASGAFHAAGRAIDRVFGWQETRSFVRRRLSGLGWTFAVLLLYVVTVAAVFVGGQWARDLFDEVGFGRQAADVWSIARWPVAVITAMVMVLVIYTVAPSPPDDAPKRRFLSLGAIVTVLLWLAAIALFGVYVRNFSHYGAVYGVAGALIVLLLFLYLTNVLFLYGAELNAEIDRRRMAWKAAVAAQDELRAEHPPLRTASTEPPPALPPA